MDKEVFLNNDEQIADQRDWRAKDNEEGVFRGDILPIKRQVGDSHISLGLPSWMLDAYNALTLPHDILNNYEPTIEDVNNFALTVGVGGITGGASGAVPEGAIGTFSGGKPKHFTSLFPEKRVKFEAFGQVLYDENMPGFTNFRSPVEDAIQNMDFPAKGSNILKDLRQNAPTIRKSELDTYPLDKIDPNKKYTKDDINSLFEPWGNPNVSGSQNTYDNYQRQSVVDSEIDYAEFPIDYGTSEERRFKANGQHYNSDTLAHTRLSVRQPENNSPYVLVEELQSDLMQKGYAPEKVDKTMDDLIKDKIDRFSGYLESYDSKKEADLDMMAYKYSLYNNAYFETNDQKYKDLANELIGKFKSVNPPDKSYAAMSGDFDFEDIVGQLTIGAKPPINSTTEGVRLGILQAIAYAQQKGVDKIVLPPLDRILQAREGGLGEGRSFEDMMKPNSPFYSTYINSTNKVLNQLQNELGGKIKIGPRELQYKSNEGFPEWDDAGNIIGDNWQPELDGVIPTETEQFPKSINRNYSNLGVEIDISGLGKLDASKPRFNKGGLVIGR